MQTLSGSEKESSDAMRGAPRTLLLIPSYAKTGVLDATRADRHPTMDYYALQDRLGADLLDYAAVERDTHPFVAFTRRLGKDVGLAALGFVRRKRYEVIYSNGENVSIPLAAMLACGGRRPAHLLIGHHLSPRKKGPFLRALHRWMDAIFVYAETQRQFAQQQLGIPAAKLHLIPFHADHHFYRPLALPAKRMICSAGLEWRDYPTLIEAVKGLDLEVRLAAASPWSKHRNETEDRTLPPNVSARRYEYGDLRDLYAQALFVVVPLYENDFQAGVTTILEAMAMGKAVIATKTTGQRDVIEDGVNGLYVPPGDAGALRAAIERLLANPAEAQAMGARGRAALEAGMSLDLWVERITRVAVDLAAARG